MGWKAIQDHYRIGHSVQVVPDKGICIGSPYVHDLITITLAGDVLPGKLGLDGNKELQRYKTEMEGDPAKLRELIAQEDVFERSISVFTYEGADIIECHCEELEWPNVTHDGRMMYENMFSPDRKKVVSWAMRSARSSIEWMTQIVAEKKSELTEAEARLDRVTTNLATLRVRENVHG